VITVQSPRILAEHLGTSIEHLSISPGLENGFYE
jgi:hypothetical protein